MYIYICMMNRYTYIYIAWPLPFESPVPPGRAPPAGTRRGRWHPGPGGERHVDGLDGGAAGL